MVPRTVGPDSGLTSDPLTVDGPTGSATGPAEDLVEDVVERVTEQLDDILRCLRCQHEVTARRHAVEIGGAHTHMFRNPAGWSFRIGCFSDAPGAVVAGVATYAHTWFPGYAWRLAHCRGCGTHLGWWFVGASDAFAGLVLTRLA